jgi:UDP-N-acetylmuramoyl-tripeptide--D-alanyl-D-alanine ligase
VAGSERDGHDFIGAAIQAGATGLVISRELAELNDPAEGLDLDLSAVTVIWVPDTLIALQQTAATVRRRSSALVVAVTGSAGKTTAKTLITEVLASKYPVLSNLASFNNHLGVPLTLTGIEPAHSHIVSEIGTNHRGEIAHLSTLVVPDIAVITNVGFAHLGNFTSRAELAQEKTDLLAHTTPGGVWILNGDDLLLTTAAEQRPEAAQATIVRVGFGPGNDLRATDVIVDEQSTQGVIEIDGLAIPFSLSAAGRHFAYAAMFAVAVGRAAGIDPATGLHALRGIAPPSGRATLRRINERLLIIDDSYNGSPDAMLTSLDLLARLTGNVKIAVLGEMRELGASSVRLHTLVGQKVEATATHLVTVGDEAEPLRLAAASAGMNPECIRPADSATQAFTYVRQILTTANGHDAVVLIKGSRFMHMERLYLGFAGRNVTCPLGACTLYMNCNDCNKLELITPDHS